MVGQAFTSIRGIDLLAISVQRGGSAYGSMIGVMAFGISTRIADEGQLLGSRSMTTPNPLFCTLIECRLCSVLTARILAILLN